MSDRQIAARRPAFDRTNLAAIDADLDGSRVGKQTRAAMEAPDDQDGDQRGTSISTVKRELAQLGECLLPSAPLAEGTGIHEIERMRQTATMHEKLHVARRHLTYLEQRAPRDPVVQELRAEVELVTARMVELGIVPRTSFVKQAVQAKSSGSFGGSASTHEIAASGVSGATGTLPHLQTIQRAFGRHDVSNVRVQVGGRAASAARAIGARAYTTGATIAFDSEPDLHTAAHEAAHVVQQRGGVSLANGIGAAGDQYEQHADRVADEVVAGRSVSYLLDIFGTGSSTTAAVQRKESPSTGKLRTLSLSLINGIDVAARVALEAMEATPPDAAEAKRRVTLVADRLDHLLSVTVQPDNTLDTNAALVDLAPQARIAFGHALVAASSVIVHDKELSRRLHEAIRFVNLEVAPGAHWGFLAPMRGGKASHGGFTKDQGVNLVTGTLEVIRGRMDRVYAATSPDYVAIVIQNVLEELQYCVREATTLAAYDDARTSIKPAIEQTGDELGKLEYHAFQWGLGQHEKTLAAHAADAKLRELVKLPPREVRNVVRDVGLKLSWEESLAAMNAVVNVINHFVENRGGVGHDVSKPGQQKNVPSVYKDLVDDWFLAANERVDYGPGGTVELRGAALRKQLPNLIERTRPLISTLQKESKAGTTKDLFGDYYRGVDRIWASAQMGTVDDQISARKQERDRTGASPLDHLKERDQAVVVGVKLASLGKDIGSVSQRLASENKELAKRALDTFKEYIKGKDDPLSKQLQSATSLGNAALLLQGVGYTIYAISQLSDGEMQNLQKLPEYKRLKEYGLDGEIAGMTLDISAILKLAGAVAYSGVTVGGFAMAAILHVKGNVAAAAELVKAVGTVAKGLSIGINALNFVHGAIALVTGDGLTAKIDGAAEMIWGGAGVARNIPALAAYSMMLTAVSGSVLIGWTTIKLIGSLAVASVSGMVSLELKRCFVKLQEVALDVANDAVRLQAALDVNDAGVAADLSKILKGKLEASRQTLEWAMTGYIARAEKPKIATDPGTYKALGKHFAGLTLDFSSIAKTLVSAERFTATAISCFADAPKILGEAIEETWDEHGKRMHGG